MIESTLFVIALLETFDETLMLGMGLPIDAIVVTKFDALLAIVNLEDDDWSSTSKSLLKPERLENGFISIMASS